MKRNIVSSKEGRISILQFIGFVLLLLGIILILYVYFSGDENLHAPSRVAIGFFIVMLGFSLAFPSLLEGNEGLSTMRIIVFMVTNVICMLLLKIGWADSITSLQKIGLDGYWMGIIAFVFGAKAVQSFFESRMAVPDKLASAGLRADDFSKAEIAKLAVIQNEEFLRVKFPNIATVSDSVRDLNGEETHAVTLYLQDKNVTGLPAVLGVRMPDGTTKTIATEIVTGVGKGKIQYSQLNTELANAERLDYVGSICCEVRSLTDESFKGLVTSGHIYTYGKFDNSYNGLLNPSQRRKISLNGAEGGQWFYRVMNSSQDLAIAKIDGGQPDQNYKKFAQQFYELGDADVRPEQPNVTVLSRNNRSRTAYVIDYNVGLDIYYDEGPVYKRNVILIGSTNDRETSNPVSEEGDSGSCVYHTRTGNLIGMLLGCNEKYSFVLPVRNTLEGFNLVTV